MDHVGNLVPHLRAGKEKNAICRTFGNGFRPTVCLEEPSHQGDFSLAAMARFVNYAKGPHMFSTQPCPAQLSLRTKPACSYSYLCTSEHNEGAEVMNFAMKYPEEL
jgi:hypothetical protein